MSFQYVPLGGGAKKPRSPSNRRASVRYQCGPATVGRLVQPDAHQMQPVWVLNLSLTGIGLLLEHRIEPDTFLVVQLKDVTGQRLFELPATLVHITRQPTGDWLAGCEFLTRLSDDDLDALL
jgi:hypothetical protein